MRGDLELGSPADRFDRSLELLVAERRHSSAALAEQVVMVGSPRIDPLVAGRVAAEVDPPDQIQLLELLQCPVNAGPPDPLQPPIDLDRGDRAVLPGNQLDDAPPGAAASVAGLAQGAQRVLGPAGTIGGGGCGESDPIILSIMRVIPI